MFIPTEKTYNTEVANKRCLQTGVVLQFCNLNKSWFYYKFNYKIVI